ncbi:MAG: radical SAM protein, partial [Deltaproteobacteria bacterium]|nr:radical SAM protein [Deltaproteobacteria bacterium]
MDLLDPIKAICALGEQVGLTPSEIEKATKRISLALASVMSTADSDQLPDSTRMLHGLGKNLTDNPMLVAWGLKIAARTNDHVFAKFVDNFLLGTVLERKPIVKAMAKELGYHPPSTLLINPTMRCNLRCQGCYAHSFNQKTDMDRGLIEKILVEARELGIQFIAVTGGEPFLYPEIEDLFGSFPDINFMVYTNAQEIDAERAKRLAELGNVWPAISVEGFEKETDLRRGPGVYRKLSDVMDQLKSNGVMFGISTVPTRHNTELLASDEFLDHYIEKGALFGWVFTYMPVGKNPDPSLMATPQQRELLRQTSLNWRKTKPIFMADFWNDGPLCGG